MKNVQLQSPNTGLAMDEGESPLHVECTALLTSASDVGATVCR